MQNLSCAKALLISLALVLSSCAVKTPNVPVCVEISLGTGNCVKIVSGEQFDIDDEHKFEGKTWWDIRPAMVQVPASSWVEIKKFIIEICKKTNQCDSQVTSWDRSVNAIDKNLKNKMP